MSKEAEATPKAGGPFGAAAPAAGGHAVTIKVTLNVDGADLPQRSDTMSPQNRINPKIVLPYSDGVTYTPLADVNFTAADMRYLYLLSTVDASIKITDGTNTWTQALTAGKPYIWAATSGALNPLGSATPGAITTVTGASAVNLDAAHAAATITVDIGILSS